MQNKHRKDEDALLKKKADERELLRKKKQNMQKGSNPTIPPLEVDEEVDNKPATPAKKPDQQLKARTQRINREKQQILRRKLQTVRQSTQGGTSTSDITAGYEPEGEQIDERLGGKGYSRQAAASSVYPGKKGTGDWEDSDRGEGNKAKRRAGEKVKAKSPTYLAWVKNKKLKEDKVKGNENVKINPKIGPTCPECAGMVIDEECQNCGKKCASSDVKEGFKTQYGKKGKLSKTDAPGSRHDHTHDVDPRMADYVPNKKVRKSSKAETRANVLKFDMKKEEVVTELNRLEKEQGKKSGGSKDKALNIVRNQIRKETGRPAGQQKKVKGAKSTGAVGKYLKRAQDKKAYAAKAKKAGFKSTQAYTDTMARYGGEDNYKKGRGLGT
mgnify:CR=1 FL=1